jgi:Flp pilus assembly protein TadD
MAGRFHLEQGRFREAADELQAAVRLDDSLAEAHGALAAALEALGRLSEAGFHAARARQLQAQAPR